MSVRPAAWVATGGVMGATCRWAITTALPVTAFPVATLVVNLGGAALLGWLTTRPIRRHPHHLGATTGFCGGLTTFSTVSVEMSQLRIEDPALFAGYLFVSLMGGALAYLGARWAAVGNASG